jgi:hypothetical protein
LLIISNQGIKVYSSNLFLNIDKKLYLLIIKNLLILPNKLKTNLWGLGIGDWGLGIGDWAQSPIPNPQSP